MSKQRMCFSLAYAKMINMEETRWNYVGKPSSWHRIMNNQVNFWVKARDTFFVVASLKQATS